MADAAAKRPGVATQVGFNYLKNPMLGLAKDIIASGEIGEIRTFRGVHAEDYMADAAGALDLAARPGGRRRRPGRHRQPHPRDRALPGRPDLVADGARSRRRSPSGPSAPAHPSRGPSRSTTSPGCS